MCGHDSALRYVFCNHRSRIDRSTGYPCSDVRDAYDHPQDDGDSPFCCSDWCCRAAIREARDNLRQIENDGRTGRLNQQTRVYQRAVQAHMDDIERMEERHEHCRRRRERYLRNTEP